MRKRFVGFTLSPLPFALSLVVALLFTLCAFAEAQLPKKVPRIAYAGAGSAGIRIEALRQGLRELGWIEGKNIIIEQRYLESKLERSSEIAAELVRLKFDVIVWSQASKASRKSGQSPLFTSPHPT